MRPTENPARFSAFVTSVLTSVAALGVPAGDVVAAPVCAEDKVPAERPNIVVILADDLGYADIGVHGAKDIPTPHLDSLARNGVRCTSGYVSGPYCSPTRAALLTGRYQQRFGHEFNPGAPAQANVEVGLPVKETTLAQRLKEAGYRTGLVGKWHLGHGDPFLPQNRGFEEFFGFLGGAHSYLASNPRPNNPILRGRETVAESEYLTDAFAREAVAFVERHRSGPFFLYLAFNAVHTPLEVSEKYLARFTGIAEARRRRYAAMLSAMDDAIGAVLEKLADAGLEERTLVFFLSDNGGPPANASVNAPLRGHKAQTWEGGVRVPFLVQWKSKLPAGRTYDLPVIQLDIAPTALAAAGIEVEAEWRLDGVNLLPFLRGQASGAPHAALFWRFGDQMAARAGDWKLVKAAGGGGARGGPRGSVSTLEGAQLYNLAKDLGEQNDLASAEPAKVQELRALWEKWNAELIDPQWRPRRAAAGARGGAKK